MNQVLKPNMTQKHTIIRVHKILARPILTYGSEAQTICKTEESRITVAEMKLMRRTAGCNHMDHKKIYRYNEGTKHRTSHEFHTDLQS
jgi:hypothetical protein